MLGFAARLGIWAWVLYRSVYKIHVAVEVYDLVVYRVSQRLIFVQIMLPCI